MSAREPEREPTRLGYLTPPVPGSAMEAVAAGALSYAEFAVLAFLYWRADWTALTVSLSLEQIAEGVAWGRSPARLWQTIRSLEGKGWLSYRTRPGPKARYEFALARGEPSEIVRRFSTPSRLTPEESEARIARALAPSGISEPAETSEEVEGTTARRFTPPARRFGEAANPHPKRDSDDSAAPPLGDPQNLRESEELSVKGGPSGVPSLTDDLVTKDRGDRPLSEIIAGAKEAAQNGSSALGDPGFLTLLHERYRAGSLTRPEWLRRVELHGLLWRARPADEEQLLGEVGQLVAEGVLVEAGS